MKTQIEINRGIWYIKIRKICQKINWRFTMKYNFPKVDLHLHLDGSLLPEVAYELAKERKLSYGDWSFEKLREEMIITGALDSLHEYLKRFDIPIALLQDEEALERASYELMKNLAGQGLVYSEVRFAPQLHCRKGCTQRKAAEAVVRGIKKAEKEYNIHGGVLLCAMTYQTLEENQEANMETIKVAGELLGQGVVGADLAGAEGIVPMIERAPIFEEARKQNIPFTIHAGEVHIPEDVKLAIEFGARRIGHGQSCIDNDEVLKLVIDKKIPLELCLTSNIQTFVRESFEAHPLKRLYDAGVLVTMNTDNMILSNVTLDDEYDIAAKTFGFTEADFIQMNKNSIQAAFMEENLRKELLKLF